jgi:hypothetical protein
MIQNKNKSAALMTAALGITGLAYQANADTLNSFFIPPPGSINDILASDQTVAELLKAPGNTSTTTIQVNDTIHGIFTIPQLFASTDGGAPLSPVLRHSSGNSEWSGEYNIKVVSKTLVSAGSPSTPLDDVFSFVFGVDTAFDPANKTLIRLYEDQIPGTTDFDINDTVTTTGETPGPDKVDAAQSVTDGNFYFGLGFGSADNKFTGSGNDRLNQSSTLVTFLRFFYTLDRTEAGDGSVLDIIPGSDSAPPDGSGGTGEIIGSAGLKSSASGSLWRLNGAQQLAFKTQNPAIPEPASMTLLAIGAGSLLLRRRSA